MGNYSKWIMCIIIILSSINFSQPVSLRSDIKIKELSSVGKSTVRITKNPADGNLYILENNGKINRVVFSQDSSVTIENIYSKAEHGISEPLGIAFSNDGTLFLVGTETNGSLGVATIMKGTPDSTGTDKRNWSILAKTVEYDYGSTYNHRMSGIAVDPSQQYIYVNSGARTDHGELRNGQREAGLTSIILKLPVTGNNIELKDDREWLRTNGYLFAEGIRNDFALAFSASGDLFSVENSGDRDDPEEMNWLREGHHYGFPWVIGGDGTPQQFTPYNPQQDPLLSPNAWGGGNLYETFSNDPNYPDPPDGVVFTGAIRNYGPDGDKFRDTSDGEISDASNLDTSITTFSSHRSPNGLVFDKDSVLAEDLSGGAFVISFANGELLQALGDNGEDLIHISLIKEGDNYKAFTHRLISSFHNPLGIEMVRNKLFIVETGLWNNFITPKLYEITLPQKAIVNVKDENEKNIKSILDQNYPNPFNPNTTINVSLSEDTFAKLTIYNILGKEVRVLVNTFMKAGNHNFIWDGNDANGIAASSGIYFYKLNAGAFSDTKRMILLK